MQPVGLPHDGTDDGLDNSGYDHEDFFASLAPMQVDEGVADAGIGHLFASLPAMQVDEGLANPDLFASLPPMQVDELLANPGINPLFAGLSPMQADGGSANPGIEQKNLCDFDKSECVIELSNPQLMIFLYCVNMETSHVYDLPMQRGHGLWRLRGGNYHILQEIVLAYLFPCDPCQIPLFRQCLASERRLLRQRLCGSLPYSSLHDALHDACCQNDVITLRGDFVVDRPLQIRAGVLIRGHPHATITLHMVAPPLSGFQINSELREIEREVAECQRLRWQANETDMQTGIIPYCEGTEALVRRRGHRRGWTAGLSFRGSALVQVNLQDKDTSVQFKGITFQESLDVSQFSATTGFGGSRFLGCLQKDTPWKEPQQSAQIVQHIQERAFFRTLQEVHGVWVRRGSAQLDGCIIRGFRHGSGIRVSDEAIVSCRSSLHSNGVGLLAESGAQATMNTCDVRGNDVSVIASCARVRVVESVISHDGWNPPIEIQHDGYLEQLRNQLVTIKGPRSELWQAVEAHQQREREAQELERKVAALEAQRKQEREAARARQEDEDWATAVRLRLELEPGSKQQRALTRSLENDDDIDWFVLTDSDNDSDSDLDSV